MYRTVLPILIFPNESFSTFGMLRFGFLLLALSILPTSVFPRPNQTIIKRPPYILMHIEVTPYGSTNLLCRWTGIGEHCPPERGIADGVSWEITRVRIPFLNKNETKSELLARIERVLPLNTFTIVKSTNVSDKCEITTFQCNSLLAFGDLQTYINFVSRSPNYGKPGYGVKDNIQFYIDEKTNEIGTRVVLDV